MSSSFKPSNVVCSFHSSSLRQGEKETIAAWVVTFLATEQNDQFCEFTWKQFMAFVKKGSANLQPIYLAMMEGQFASRTLSHIGPMVKDGYLVYRKDGDVEYLSVGEKLMAFYSDYVPQTV